MENQKTNLFELSQTEVAKPSSENPFETIYKVSELAKVISKNFDVKKAQALFTEEIDYSIINEESFQHFKTKMESHKQRMVLAKHNFLKLKEGEAFDDFCRYVHLQIEGLLNYYTHIVYKNHQALYERNIIYCLDSFLFNKANNLSKLKAPFKILSEFPNIIAKLFQFKSGGLRESDLTNFLQPILDTFNTANSCSITVKQIAGCLKFSVTENLDGIEFYIKSNIFHGDYLEKKGNDDFLYYRKTLNEYRNFETSHTNTLKDYDSVLTECKSTIADSGSSPKQKNEAEKKMKLVSNIKSFTTKQQSKNKIFEMLIDTLQFVKEQKEGNAQTQPTGI